MENVLEGYNSMLPLTPVMDEKSDEQRAAEDAAMHEVRDVASIPGWPRIKEQMEKDAYDLKMHANLVFGTDIDDAKLGRDVRSRLLLAQWIEAYVERIESAVVQVKREDERITKEANDGVGA